MVNRRKIWLACGVSLGLPLPIYAQSVNSVAVTHDASSVTIHVSGSDLERPAQVGGWHHGLTFEWKAGFGGHTNTIQVNHADVASVWYGWYGHNLHRVRLQIRTDHPVTPVIAPAADGWMVTVSAPQRPLKRPVSSGAEAPHSRVEADPYNAKTFPDRVPTLTPAKLEANKLPNAEATPIEEPKVGTAKATVIETPKKSSAVASPRILSAKAKVEVSNFPTTVPPLDIPPAVHKEAPKTAPAPKLVSLDCTDAELSQVLKGLAMQTGANIMISPEVKGKVTASLHGVPVEQALRQLAALTSVKFQSLEGTYVFGEEPKSAVSAIGGAAAQEPGEEVVQEVVHLKSQMPDEIKSALDEQFKARHLTVITPTSVKAANLQAASQAAGGTAVSANAGASEGTGHSGFDATVAYKEEAGPYVILAGPKSVVTDAANLAKQMDDGILSALNEAAQRDVVGIELMAYDVKYADPRSLRESLITEIPGLYASVAPNNAGAYISYTEGKQIKQSQQSISAQPQGQNAQQPAANQQMTQTGVSTTSVPDFVSFEQPFSSEEAIAVPMRLLLRGTPAQLDQAKQALSILDIAPKQVALELRVMDLTKEDAINAGLNWGILTGGALTIANVNNGIYTLLGKNVNAGVNPVAMGANPVPGAVTLQLDKIANKTNLIARPNLVALDGRASEIFIGDVIRYLQSSSSSGSGSSQTVAELSVGVRMAVLPRVGADNNITLDLRPRVGILNGFDSNGLPQTSERDAQSTIAMMSGQTIAIGGLIQDQDVKNMEGIPILSDLPIIGHLFKHTSIDHQRKELVIFITAKTIDGPVGMQGSLPVQQDFKDLKPGQKG